MRAFVLILLAACSGSSLEDLDLDEYLDDLEDEGPAFYSYENEEGRTVFVSDPAMIPSDAHPLPVDVSHVDLNFELGRELDEAVHAEHARLVGTDFCEEERTTAARGTLEQMWHETPHWVGIGVVVLLLLLTAPFVARRVGAPKWIRVLVLVIPLLLFLGLLTQSMQSATDALREARGIAPLCEEDALANASPADQLGIVRQLRQAYARRQARIDAIIESAR